MIIALAERDPEITRFRAQPWPFQVTFTTPLKVLEDFVNCFCSIANIEAGALSTDLVVFEPREMIQLLTDASIPIEDIWRFRLRATGDDSIRKLLVAALGDWIDFAFVSDPPSFALYADHDEFTTFFSRNETKLAKLATALKAAGFQHEPRYKRGSISAKQR